MRTRPAPIVQASACQRRRTSCQPRNTPRLGRSAIPTASAIDPTGRSSHRHAIASGSISRMLTLPSTASLRTGKLNAMTANPSTRMSGRTGMSAQAASSAPTRSTYQSTALSPMGTSTRGSIATPSGGA